MSSIIDQWMNLKGPTSAQLVLDTIEALEKSKAVLNGLSCLGCKKQGEELADECCRDADCDAGFYGINADEVKEALDAINQSSPNCDGENQ